MTIWCGKMPNLKMSQRGIHFLEDLEGCELTVYLDKAGHKTVGVGHKNDSMVVGTKITQQQADELLEKDLLAAESAVNSFVTAPINQNQFDALVSLTFNIGGSAFKHSTLLLLLNCKEYKHAADEFSKWIYSNHQVDEILVERRKRERALFLEPLAGTVV